MRHKLTNLLVVALTAVGLTACDEGTLAPEGQGTIVVFLTDAAGDVEKVWVQIEEMYVRGNGDRFDLLDEPTDWIELTALTQSSLELVSGVELPAGTYQEIRMVVGEAVLETMTGEVFMTDGAEHPDYTEDPDGSLICPSCSQSGFKVKLPGGGFELTEDGYVMMADFDVSQSFGRERGNSEQWVMHPTIHASALQSAGSISGTVVLDGGVVLECPAASFPGLDIFVPTATAQNLTDGDGAIVRTGNTDATGVFTIDPLAPDVYNLAYETEIELDGHTLTLVATVSQPTADVAEGAAVDGITYTVESANCAPTTP